ncbi:hypothetical protein Q9233_016521 [Columba guinea]|nr:hypothetical protein Q9233_016521 [Columba guinea]
MEETKRSLNCCGYKREYKVSLFYLPGIDHTVQSYEEEVIWVFEARPTWRTIAYPLVHKKIYEESKMNLEQERPFVCSAPGCSQRFPTEDHLMIHRHKHEMTLKFPSIKTDNMLSDQTPTPTRFLKNCEEVGLFNDIDCSLEHEFRKAQEEENNKREKEMRRYLLMRSAVQLATD